MSRPGQTDRDEPAPFPVRTMVLTERREITVARPALGLTLYLDQPLVWAREAARAVLLGFLERIPTRDLRYFITSARPEFHQITANDMARLLHDLPLPANRSTVRHLFWLRLLDDVNTPSLAFSYREIDSERQARCGFLELTFPADFDHRVLADFVAQIADQWPFLAGIAGYSVSWNPGHSATGQHVAYAWCKRFLGMDLADADELCWHLPRGLPGTGWLTLIGRGHAEKLEIDLAAVEKRAWSPSVAVKPLRQGLVIAAGDAPTLGDLNRLVYPFTYAEVARILAPHVIADPPPFWGDAWREEPDRTARWYRRFVDPEGWR